jgi:hypothetical protein
LSDKTHVEHALSINVLELAAGLQQPTLSQPCSAAQRGGALSLPRDSRGSGRILLCRGPCREIGKRRHPVGQASQGRRRNRPVWM